MTASLEVLTSTDRARVHERTLHVLATVGMRVDSGEGRRILAGAGAIVDETSRTVRFPSDLVERSLALAPKRFSLGGRDAGWSFPLNEGRCTLLNSCGGPLIVDHVTGEPRTSTVDDWRAATRLVDAFDDIGVGWTHPGSLHGDTLADWIDYNIDFTSLFSRHLNDAFSHPAWAPWLLELLSIVCGGAEEVRRRHPYSFLLTPVSPLIIEAPGTDSWLALRGWDIPVAVMPMPMMGATAPGSMLGVTLVANCEVIGALCLVQAAEPGTPFIYAPIIAAIDPRSGRLADNAPYAALSCAGTEMARFYGLPAIGQAFSAEAFVSGAQSCLESGFSTLMATLSWPDILCGPGSLGGGFGMTQLVIDMELWRICAKARAGIAVDDGHWLSDAIERVGPGGHFLGERSTRENARTGEWFTSRMGVHETFDWWNERGRPDLLDEAQATVHRILATHEPLPLSDDQRSALAQLRRRAAQAREAIG